MPGPARITIRSYQVGFGDCFLLGFHYAATSRYVLIDFGSTGLPKGVKPNQMLLVAKDIAQTCGGKLHAVVATHRHKDHISGFATNKGKGSGDVIAALNPDVVIQPWTEDPKAKPDAKGPVPVSKGGRAMVGMLADMQGVAAAVQQEIQSWPASPTKAELSFLGETNLSNLSAVKNLMQMGKRRLYVRFGSPSGLRLPGVKVQVLGPPTPEQSASVLTQRSTDPDEFWQLQALTGRSVIEGSRPFSSGFVLPGRVPRSSRWLAERIHAARREQLRELVRIVDAALNNTSVILLFEIGKHKFLFPGDAQIENWSYALSKKAIAKQLADVAVYKVGHHGSLNATPKSLWNAFARRSKKKGSGRLVTFVSTMANKHGKESRDTEVPRRTLVKALQAESDFHTTQPLKAGNLFLEETIEL